MRKLQLTLFSVLSLVTLNGSVRAQDAFSSIGDAGISMGSATLTQVQNNLVLNNITRAAQGKSRANSRQTGKSRVAPSSFSYRVTPALKKQAINSLVTRLRTKNPSAAQAVRREFSKHDYDRIYRNLTVPSGLRSTDTADVLTAYTVLGWLISTNTMSNPSRVSVRNARVQIATQLRRNATLTAATKRAQVGEELKILFVVLHAGWQDAVRKKTVSSYSNSVAQMFQVQSRTDLRRLNLGPNGFSQRS